MDLITAHQADLAFTILPVLGIVIAVVAAVVVKRSAGNPVTNALQYGGPFILIGVLWRVYGIVSAHFGAASVANLLVNLALFVVVGGVCGVVGKRLSGNGRPPRHGADGDDGDALAGVAVGPGPAAPSGRGAATIPEKQERGN